MRWALAILAAVVLAGCAAQQKQAQDAVPVVTAAPESVVEIDQQQIAAAVATAVRAELSADVTAAVESSVTANVTGYSSQFGVGAALIVGMALFLTIWLSHRREMARLRSGRSQE